MVLIQNDQGACDDCAMIQHLLSLPQASTDGRYPPVMMDAAQFAAALWSTAPVVRSASL